MRAERIAGYCYTLFCDRATFAHRRKAGQLPAHPFVVRMRYAFATPRSGPARR